jgi:hypothetical protein
VYDVIFDANHGVAGLGDAKTLLNRDRPIVAA